ncbi:MAG TPA: hypothetical protein VGS11_05025 [Candidatus Bathyarchaeia archaeon]|nr:hypothetical protein [Candidatus Bathyarchaeia archaeon]
MHRDSSRCNRNFNAWGFKILHLVEWLNGKDLNFRKLLLYKFVGFCVRQSRHFVPLETSVGQYRFDKKQSEIA